MLEREMIEEIVAKAWGKYYAVGNDEDVADYSKYDALLDVVSELDCIISDEDYDILVEEMQEF